MKIRNQFALLISCAGLFAFLLFEFLWLNKWPISSKLTGEDFYHTQLDDPDFLDKFYEKAKELDLPENEDEEHPPVPALRIVFDGGMENQHVIADLVKQCDVEVNILSANIRRLNDKPYGQMLIEMPRDDAARRKIVEFLTGKGLTVKEVWPQ